MKIALLDVTEDRPIYVRMPKPPARCRFTGLSRSMLYNLVLPCKANNYRPPGRSKLLKTNKYAQRGVRLIDLRSLLEFLDQCPTTVGLNSDGSAIEGTELAKAALVGESELLLATAP